MFHACRSLPLFALGLRPCYVEPPPPQEIEARRRLLLQPAACESAAKESCFLLLLPRPVISTQVFQLALTPDPC